MNSNRWQTKNEEDKRTVRITITVSPKEVELIRFKCVELNLSLAEFVVQSVQPKTIKQKKKSSNKSEAKNTTEMESIEGQINFEK